MASIHRRSRSPNYWAAFMGPDGKRCFRTTGTGDRKLAMRTALEYESTARDGRQGRLTEGRVRAVMADLFARANREKLPSATAADFLASWKSRKAIEVSDASMAAYEQTASLLEESLGRKAVLPVDAITLGDATRFRDNLARRVAPSTVNKLLKIARIILGDAVRDGLTTENPFAKVKRLKAATTSRRPFTIAELRDLLAVASSEWRGMILCGIYLGQRLGDLACMTWQNVDLAREEVTLVTAKTGRIMHIPLAGPLLSYFMGRPSPDDPSAPLFPSLAGRATSSLSNQFTALLASIGLAEKRPHRGVKQGRSAVRATGGMSFHCLRHTMTSLLKNAGISDAVAMELVGHDTAAISKLYTHISTDAMRQAVHRMPDVTKEESKT